MTQQQIDLREVKLGEAKLEEDKRHNLVTEAYTAQHYLSSDSASMMQAQASMSQAETASKRIPIDWMNAQTNRMSVEEAGRHNRAVEDETQRHNETTERYTKQDLDERFRHNVALEHQGWADIAVAERQATVRETEAALKGEQLEFEKERFKKEYLREIANDATNVVNDIRRLNQTDRKLDIDEYKAHNPKGDTINIYDNDYPPINDYGYPNHSGGGGSFDDEGFFERVGGGIDDIVDATGDLGREVINFMTGGH